MWLAFATAGLPGVVPATAAPNVFSAARAQIDLEFISAEPHPVGTVGHDRVRDYLVDRLRTLGCQDVHVQSATGFNMLSGPIAATIANVVCREPGTRGGPAIVLMAHYDAVPRSFGAGDDGAAVAAILETLRALQHAPPLAHDLIVVFSDAEETGLLGAEAFVDLHPWASDAGVVLNFEGRGDQGPVFMFQTSPGNSQLIAALADGVPDVRSNSFAGEVYRHLPSDTDLSIWLHARPNVAGLNFADIGGFTHYHTPIDNLGSLDPRVMQQMGGYALAMTRSIDHIDLAHRTAGADASYFNAPFIGVVHYPASLAIPFGTALLVCTLVLLVVALRVRIASWRGMLRGSLALIAALLVPVLLTLMGWKLVAALHPGYRDILQGEPYNAGWYLVAFGVFAVVVAGVLQRQLAPRATRLDLALPSLLLWALLGEAAAIALPAASYLFTWPLAGALAGCAWLLGNESADRRPHALIALAAIPALVLWLPLIRALELALTVRMLPLCAGLLALVATFVVFAWQRTGHWQRGIAMTGMLIAVLALIQAERTAGFSPAHKRPDSLLHLTDADESSSWWVSLDRTTDAWTQRAIGADPERRSFHRYLLGATGDSLMFRPAHSLAAPPPVVHLISSDPVSGGRRVHLHVDHVGAGQQFSCYILGPGTAGDLTINGRRLADSSADRYLPLYHMVPGGPVLRYSGVPNEGLELQFTVRGVDRGVLRVITAVDGFPAGATLSAGSRPASMMSKPFVPTDMSIVERLIPF